MSKENTGRTMILLTGERNQSPVRDIARSWQVAGYETNTVGINWRKSPRQLVTPITRLVKAFVGLGEEVTIVGGQAYGLIAVQAGIALSKIDCVKVVTGGTNFNQAPILEVPTLAKLSGQINEGITSGDVVLDPSRYLNMIDPSSYVDPLDQVLLNASVLPLPGGELAFIQPPVYRSLTSDIKVIETIFEAAKEK